MALTSTKRPSRVFRTSGLQQLLNKVKKERAVTDAPAVAAATSVEAQRLESIVGKYKVSPEDIAALIAWRHSHDF